MKYQWPLRNNHSVKNEKWQMWRRSKLKHPPSQPSICRDNNSMQLLMTTESMGMFDAKHLILNFLTQR